MKVWLFNLYAAIVVWFFGSYQHSLRLWPWRRWCLSWSFALRWMGMARASALLWKAARLFATERVHQALAAHSTRLLMHAIMEGRE